MRETFSLGYFAFHSSSRFWTMPPEKSLPWTQLMGPSPVKSPSLAAGLLDSEPFESPLEQAAKALSASAPTEPWIKARRECV